MDILKIESIGHGFDLLERCAKMTENLAEAGLKSTMAEVSPTEYGERLRVIVPLIDRTIDVRGDLIEPDRYQPEIEVMNSVDKSTASTVLLRWRRLICLNGMFTVEEDRIR